MPHKESKEEIAKRLEITRNALGFKTQAAFAEALDDNVTPQRWNNYESGRDRLTLNLALVICEKWQQVTLDWLYRGDKSTLRSAFSANIDAAEKVVRLRR
jgi:DNA-binding XRE family transcriptional regulator